MPSAQGNLDPIIGQLANRRRKLGWTQSHLSLRMGWNDTLVATYEAGRRNPHPRHLRRWANELGLDITLTSIGEPS